MLKFLFSVLLLANAGLLAYQLGYLEPLLPSGREPGRLEKQLNADKLKLVPPPSAQAPVSKAEPAAATAQEQQVQTAEKQPDTQLAATGAKPEPPAAAAEKKPEEKKAEEKKPEEKQAEAAAGKPELTPVLAKEPDTLACTEIGDFDAEEASRFSAQLASAGLGERAVRRQLQEVTSHIVYIPPQADKEAVEKKAGELRRLGVEEFFIILDNSPLRWGISLGVFKQESAARAHLAALAQKGVRSARIGQRTAPTGAVAFQLRKLDPQGMEALARVRAGFAQQARGCQA